MPITNRLVVLAVVALGGSLVSSRLSAQSMVVPPQATSTDAMTRGALPGLETRFRQQFLLGESLLSGMRAGTLTSLAFRRDGHLRAQPGSVASLRVTLSHGARGPSDASARFAENRGLVTSTIYQGVLNVPSSPPLAHRDAATWAAPDAIVIPCAVPFAYPQGNLCIEVEGEPAGAGSAWWPIDFATDAITGIATPLGQACGLAGQHANRSAMVDPRTLRPGATIRLVGLGQAHAASVLTIGAAQLTPPLDLGFLGAPGCELHVSPDVVLSGVLGGPIGARPLGLRALPLQLPGGPNALSACLFAQWVNLEGAGLATTAGLKMQLANNLTALDAAVVRSAEVASGAYPEVGAVENWQMPVIRFEWR
jgi:hypothetical protein